jgi:hypothetical protein
MPPRKPDIPDVPVLDWPTFIAKFRWRQGEHVSLIGATGAGKTMLQTALSPARKFMVAVATKPTTRKDPTIERLRKVYGFEMAAEVPKVPSRHPKTLIWPKFESVADKRHQRDVINKVFDDVFTAGSFCIMVDEIRVIAKQLRLAHQLENIWTQARALDVSLLGGTQRPAWVPLDFYSQASHIFFLRMGDERDRARIGGLGHASSKAVSEIVKDLERYQFLYVNTLTGVMYKSRYEPNNDPLIAK